MKSKNLRTARLVIPALALTACGPLASSTGSQVTNVFTGYEHMTVTALVINETSGPIDVVFMNNGPHGGGCDSKSYVPYKAAAKKMTTLSESWDCSMDQWFYSEVRHPAGNAKIKGRTARFLCTDAGCRTLDVQ